MGVDGVMKVNNGLMKKLREEFWVSLHAKGFPKGIDDSAIFEAVKKVQLEALNGKRVADGNWFFTQGGCHDDDVAIHMLLAEKLGLKLGVHWDWGLELDNYHFEIAYGRGKQVEKLMKLLDLYYDASKVYINVAMQISAKKHVSRTKIQKMFSNEWERLKEEKKMVEKELEAQLLHLIDNFLAKFGVRRGEQLKW